MCSYLYLAVYHQEAFLFTTIIHEGGEYTLLQTLFYASHFLGHIPVHFVLALYFVGVYLCLEENSETIEHEKNMLPGLVAALVFLVAAATYISFKWFGWEDTISFILQEKQSVSRYEQGGSWNLHLPSTLMQFLLIPVYIYLAKLVFQLRISFNMRGVPLITASIFFFLFTTWLVNDQMLHAIIDIWRSPRYLAHSVRELATFTITYYPIALYFMLQNSRSKEKWSLPSEPLLNRGVSIFSVLFIVLFAYQVIIPLTIGISDLAQQPSFAGDQGLSIAYLLSSHYFEHFLESIFFILLTIILTIHQSKKV